MSDAHPPMRNEPGSAELTELRKAQRAVAALWTELDRDLTDDRGTISLEGNVLTKAEFEDRCFTIAHQLSDLESRCRKLSEQNQRMDDAAGAASDLRIAVSFMLNTGLSFIGESQDAVASELARHRTLYQDAYHEFEQRLAVLDQQE